MAYQQFKEELLGAMGQRSEPSVSETTMQHQQEPSSEKPESSSPKEKKKLISLGDRATNLLNLS